MSVAAAKSYVLRVAEFEAPRDLTTTVG